MHPQPPPRRYKPPPYGTSDWQVLLNDDSPDDADLPDKSPAPPARGQLKYVMYEPKPRPPRRRLPSIPIEEDPREELRELVEIQEKVEEVRRAELNASKLAEADPGPPLEARGLWTMQKFKSECEKTSYVYQLLVHVFRVLVIVMKNPQQGVLNDDYAVLTLLDKLLKDAIEGFPVKRQLDDAFEHAKSNIIVSACSSWVSTISTTVKRCITVKPQEEVLSWVQHGDRSTSLENVSVTRLYYQVLDILKKAAGVHIPALEEAVAGYQTEYDEASLQLQRTTDELASVSKVLGSLKTGIAMEESKLGVVQRQLGTLPKMTSVVGQLALDRTLPLEWEKDSTFHVRSKYTTAKSPNRALYVTGDETLYAHKELTVIAILQACGVMIVTDQDVDDTLSSEAHSTSHRVGCVLKSISSTWGDILKLVLPDGRISSHIIETSFSVSHLITRLPAVKLILANLIREMKGTKVQESDVLSLGLLKSKEERQMKENLSYILEQCRHHVSTHCQELIYLYNWLVATQAITDIAVRIMPEEEEVARLTQLVNKYNAVTTAKGKVLAKHSLSLSMLVSVVGSSGCSTCKPDSVLCGSDVETHEI